MKIIKKYIWLLVIIITLLLSFAFYSIFLNYNSKIECTRGNGDVVEISFDEVGITNYKINNKKVDSDKYIEYASKFISTFAWVTISMDGESYLKIVNEYKDIVREYEEKRGAYCEQ